MLKPDRDNFPYGGPKPPPPTLRTAAPAGTRKFWTAINQMRFILTNEEEGYPHD
jgi:hypothetical protein